MHICELLSDMKDASVLTRIFLIRYIKRYGRSKVALRIVDLGRDLGIHDRGVREAIHYLNTNEFMEVEQNTGSKKGRSASIYKVGEKLESLAQSIHFDDANGAHITRMNELLDSRLAWDETGGRKRAIGLKNSETLLAIVLYASADPSGRIDDVGYSKLSALTGLNKAQLGSHVKRLKRHGLILTHRHGRFKKAGKISKSIFQLKLYPVDDVAGKSVQGGVFTSGVLRELRCAVLLSHALKVLQASEVELSGTQESELLLRVYPIRDALWKSVLDCVDFLWTIEGVRGRDFALLVDLILSIVGELMLLPKLMSEGDVKAWLMKNEKLNIYLRFREGGANIFFIQFLLACVNAFYEEAQRELEGRLGNLARDSVVSYSLSWPANNDFVWKCEYLRS